MKQTIDLKALLEKKMDALEPVEAAQTAIERAEASVPKNLMYSAESGDFQPVTEPAAPITRSLTVEEAKAFDDEMTRFIDSVLISGTDYGTIPKTTKPVLMKSGAEKVLNYLGLIARTVVTNRMEDFTDGFFSYETKVYLLDHSGMVRGEGLGAANTKEAKYVKSSGFANQNVVLKMAKKRALVDATLNVANLSARFTQDMEDLPFGDEYAEDRKQQGQRRQQPQPMTDRRASAKQIAFLERLMQEAHSSPAALNKRVKQLYGIADYHLITAAIASELIQKFQEAAQR